MVHLEHGSAAVDVLSVLGELGVPADALLNYGPYKAKISAEYIRSVQGNKDGKLILVTAINPTPAGEGKSDKAKDQAKEPASPPAKK